MEWEDITTYSQGDTKRVPGIWEIQIDRFRK